jgi:nitrate reductase assembly molybdenum cofactor insertion protein NarJ/NAD-dependent dihydropyrimidine dehydrogenase PreA subunit
VTDLRRADLFAILAELLAEPPDWMSLSGREWPLFDLLTQFAAESDLARHHLDVLAGIPCEPLDQRRQRYATLFASGSPRFWLYESAARTGRILGPQSFEMARLYHTVGLESVGAELPDHVSLELTFLSFLTKKNNTPALQQFLEKHSDWMIDLGHALKRSCDGVYAPIGQFLADWLTEWMTLPVQPVNGKQSSSSYPVIPRADDCTLCGFCAQVCPTHALKVMQNAKGDFLSLSPADCIHCNKCERICEFHALKMSLAKPEAGETFILRQSPHALCLTCGKPIASQAEMSYIVSQIGEAPWQHLCLDCRSGLYI